MHVAQFVHRYPPALGGAEAWTERLSRSLVAAGHRVSVWTTTAVQLSAFTKRTADELPAGIRVENGVTVHRYTPSLRWPGRRYWLKAASLIPICRWQAMTAPWAPVSLSMWRDAGHPAEETDVVHAIGFPYAAIIQSGLRMVRDWEVPFVITPFLHLGDPDDPRDPIRRAYTSPPLRRLLRLADRVIVQTPTEADAIRALGIQQSKIVLQGLGVDPAECTRGNRDAARQAWSIQPSEIVIGHLANLSLEKGSMDLMCAAEELRQAGAPIRLVLAGPEMPFFRRFRLHYGPTDWETYLGVLTDQQRRDFYAGIDAFVLPSRSDSFGLVFLEAWANGLPVVGYRAGGVAGLIRHEQDGLLVKCGDINGLTAAIKRLINNGDERSQWGRAGRERIASEFRWEDKLQIARDALTKWP
jgi:glycosyltransferase involved in cell wall biosynthesis